QLELAVVDAARDVGGEHQQQVDGLGAGGGGGEKATEEGDQDGGSFHARLLSVRPKIGRAARPRKSERQAPPPPRLARWPRRARSTFRVTTARPRISIRPPPGSPDACCARPGCAARCGSRAAAMAGSPGRSAR